MGKRNSRKLVAIEKQMAAADNYDEWKKLAEEHDLASGADQWKARESSRLYDFKSIRTRLDRLRKLRATGDDRGLLFALNEGIHGNMGGMGSPLLHSHAKLGSKRLIEEYIDEISTTLKYFSPKRFKGIPYNCLLYTSPSPRDRSLSRMPSSA